MTKLMRSGIPLAVLGLAALAVPLSGTAAASTTATSYQATLNPLNHATASGDFMMSLSGTTATITEHVTGLAATFNGSAYPHVQHIHIGAKGDCPTTAADKNADGVISTTEGAGNYGAIGTTLSTSGDTSPKAGTTLTVAPSGGSFTYSRTITLDPATLASVQGGTAVIVVHGLDPATLSKTAQGEKSDLVPSLPLAATSPALCGAVTTSQMSTTPTGSSPTGGGSTAGMEDETLFALGGVLLLAAGGVFAARRRTAGES
jgi:LPXTG-motif cell wall-anchored protein